MAGLIIDFTKPARITEGASIMYPSGNGMRYYKGTGKNNREFIFEYSSQNKKIKLNDFTQDTGWIFVPVSSRFQILLTEDGKVLPNPEIQLSIPNLRPKGDFKDEIGILAAFHEIGHAAHLDELLKKYESELRLPQSAHYTNRLIKTIQHLEDSLGEEGYEKFSERFAWAYAFRAVRKYGLIGQFSLENFRNFYIPHLISYGASFSKYSLKKNKE